MQPWRHWTRPRVMKLAQAAVAFALAISITPPLHSTPLRDRDDTLSLTALTPVVSPLAPSAHPSANERAPASSAPRLAKPDIMARLRDLRERQTQVLSNLDELIKKRLQSSTELRIYDQDTKLARTRVAQFGLSLEELTKRRMEFAARRDFVDQLILQFDSKWSSQPMKQFLEQQLLEMAITDLSDQRGSGKAWKFLTYLSIVIRELSEPREDTLALIEGYMNFGGVLEPGNPADYLASRNYTNGSMSATARPANREELGEHLDRRLRELGLILKESPRVESSSSPATIKRPDIELRVQAPKPPPPEEEETENNPSPSGTPSLAPIEPQ